MRALALIPLTLCLATPALAEVVRSPQGLLTVDASGQTLEGVLEQVARVVSLEMLLIDPAVRSWPVTVSVREQATPEALQAILGAAGVNYVVMGKKLYAGDPAAAVAFVPSSSSAAEGPADPLVKPAAMRDAADEADNTAARARHESEQEQNFEALLKTMAPVEHPPGPRRVTLPFPDKDGNLRTVEVDGAPDGMVMLPFPGPDGKPRFVQRNPALRNVPPPAFTGPAPAGKAVPEEAEPVRPPNN